LASKAEIRVVPNRTWKSLPLRKGYKWREVINNPQRPIRQERRAYMIHQRFPFVLVLPERISDAFPQEERRTVVVKLPVRVRCAPFPRADRARWPAETSVGR
jgi:hypothetical protein